MAKSVQKKGSIRRKRKPTTDQFAYYQDFDSQAAGLDDWSEEDAYNHSISKRAATLLLIDDDKEQLALLKILLESAKYSVVTTTDAREGLKLLDKHPIDLVVCDIVMPLLSGEEFVKHARLSEKRGEIPVIMLTSEDAELEEKLIFAGADLFCQKSQAKNLLLKQIRLLLS